MKRVSLILCGVLVCVWSSLAVGSLPMRFESGLYKSTAPADIDYQTYIDANQLLMFVTNQGSFAYDNGAMFGKADGLYFPKGTTLSCIYAGGLWLGANVGGDLRVSLAEYSHTYWPGPMVNGTFDATADVDPAQHVYKLYKELAISGFYDRSAPSDPDSLKFWNDYHQWPANWGAPVDAQGKPLFTGDQTLWCVYNDANPATHTNSAGSSQGLGVEVQQTTFAFNRTGSLGQCLFIKFLMINKGSDTLKDMYASVWADPDLGDASDDFVGCDKQLSLGYCYNATNNDSKYGSKPPAVGYDFFQGPIVPAGPSDSAYSRGGWRKGYRNLPLTSFNRYINSTDPTSAEESYRYMQGLARDGNPVTDPSTGEVTTYMFPGDPVTGTGWLDSDPADRRYMCSSGPFVMVPNDTQEVVVGVVVGQGSDRLTSVTAMKFNDLYAQSAFDLNFILPDPPARPVVTAIPDDKGIILRWGTDSEDNPGDYAFQGYNIYQGKSIAGPWKRIATYDLNDATGIIFDQEFVVEEGAVINHPVQFGSDTGIKRFFKATEDAWKGGPLHNVFDYFWAVTAYSYNPDKTPKTLENAPAALALAPEKPAGGFIYPEAYGEVLTVDHEAGLSDAAVDPLVIDPTVTNGHTYEVTFTADAHGDYLWHLYDRTTHAWLLQDQTNQSGDDAYMYTDGFQCKVMPPNFGFRTAVEIAGPGGAALNPPTVVAYPDTSNQGFYISSDRVNKTTRTSDWTRLNYQSLIGTDWWEFRFTAQGSEYYDWNTDLKWPNRAPFEVWNMGPGWPNDPANAHRVQFTILDDDESGGWSLHDRIYVVELAYHEGLPDTMKYDFPADFHIGRIRFEGNVPAPGTIVRFQTLQGHAPGDVFSFTSPVVIESTLAADTAYSMKNIKVVPNPYFNQSLYELDQFHRQVKFTNLPYECEIKVFSLAGDHVITLHKEPGSQSYLVWNMLTQHGLPLASGVYIYIVTATETGKEFVGKMAVFTEVEKLNTY